MCLPVESVNVLVTASIGEEYFRQIAAISPRIKVTDGSDFFKPDREDKMSEEG